MDPLDFPSNPSTGQTYTQNGISYTYDGNVWKRIAVNRIIFDVESKSGNHTLSSSDAGKLLIFDASEITVPENQFSVGHVVTIRSVGISTVKEQNGNVQVRFAGSNLTGDRDLAANSLCSLICIQSSTTDVFVISGSGIT